MLYVIAYDICNPKRLRKVARHLERVALRTQKSVFVFRGDAVRLAGLLDEVAGLMDLREDIVQAWKLAGDERVDGMARGIPLNLVPPAVILADQQRFLLRADKEP